MSLTLVEAKLLEALLDVREYLTRRTVNKGEYLELMGIVRKAIKTGENKQHGCFSGLHSDFCTCNEGVPGRTARKKY